MKKIILLLTGLVALNFQNQAQTVSDIDGNVYNIVTIGTQTWMKENLKTTKYNDGTAIPLVADNTAAWLSLTTPAYCNYNNTTNADTINTFGRLYNWYTVNTGKLCPIGYHLPTDAEWTTLTTFLGGESVAGGKLKELGISHWTNPNTCATNEVNFTARPGGNRFYDGSFGRIGFYGSWWSLSEDNTTNAWSRFMSNYTCLVSRLSYNKTYGFSVRCVKDLSNQINQIDNNKFTISPNPSTGRIFIDCKERNNKLSIYNLIGELVSQKQLSNDINEIDISNLQNGIYIIKIENKHGTMQQKLIKK